VNLWNDHPLAQKYQVGLLHESQIPFSLLFEEHPPTSTLNRFVRDWKDGKGNSFPKNDLEFHRVGVSGYNHGTEHLHCFPVSWAQYVLMSDPIIRQNLPSLEQFRCLTICGIVKTADKKLVLAFRSRTTVSHYKNMWHVSVAGYVDLAPARDEGGATQQFQQELEEELNILPSHIVSMKQLGLCQHLVQSSALIEICFAANVNLSTTELLARSRDAKDSWEGKIHAFPISKVKEMFSLESEEKLNPGGAASLIMALRL
jgi:hypothetical protein